MYDAKERRRQRLMPGGLPRWIRVYDNGGGLKRFCPVCLHFSDDEVCQSKVPNPKRPDLNHCGGKTIAQPEGAGSYDRYTVVFTGRFKGRDGLVHYVGMSEDPYHPQGFGQHGESTESFDTNKYGFPPKRGGIAPWGNKDSRRITFQRLPPQCQRLVVHDYMAIWELTYLEGHEFKPFDHRTIKAC